MKSYKVNENKRTWKIIKLMTLEIEKEKRLKAWSQPEIFHLTQSMQVCFVMLMGHQFVEFWILCVVNLFFSLKALKSIDKLIVLFSSLCVEFGLWCESFAGSIVLGAPITSF